MPKHLMAGRGDRREEITSGVYFKQGTIIHPDLRDEQGGPVEVEQWHYQLLSAAGTVMGHGDGYVDEDHVRSAVGSVLDDYKLPYGEGEPHDVDERDVEQGKRSATDTPKVEVAS